MFLLAAFALAAHALDCPERLTREDLSTELGKAETAYENLDTVAFRDRMNGLAGLLLPCMGDLVPPDLAARTHRVIALQQLELGNEPAALASIAAARRADASITLPEAWLPPDHPLRAPLNAPPEPVAFAKAPEPRVGTLAFDGTSGRLRPRGTPAIGQVFDTSGVAQSTVYLGPTDPLPPYAAIPRQRTTLAVAGGSSAAVGLSLLAASWLQYQSMVTQADDMTVTADTLVGMRGRTNGLYLAGATFFAAGVGFGAGAVAVGPR